ncbi:hypothetical protein NPIL_275881, partial [Nephila pilipes]
TVMEPHTSYPSPANTHYILITIEKTVFALDVVPETILTTLLQKSFCLEDFRKAEKYHQKAYKLTPPTPAYTSVEERPASGKRPLAKNPFEVPSRYKKMRIPRPRDGSQDLRHLNLLHQCLFLKQCIPLLQYLWR